MHSLGNRGKLFIILYPHSLNRYENIYPQKLINNNINELQNQLLKTSSVFAKRYRSVLWLLWKIVLRLDGNITINQKRHGASNNFLDVSYKYCWTT